MNTYSCYHLPPLPDGRAFGFVRPEFIRDVTAETSWEARKIVAAELGCAVTDVMATRTVTL